MFGGAIGAQFWAATPAAANMTKKGRVVAANIICLFKLLDDRNYVSGVGKYWEATAKSELEENLEGSGTTS